MRKKKGQKRQTLGELLRKEAWSIGLLVVAALVGAFVAYNYDDLEDHGHHVATSSVEMSGQ